MNESEVRALVRDVIARRLISTDPAASDASEPTEVFRRIRSHASHTMFVLPAGSDGDGPCLIEPAVMCNHCGYCKSYGH
jgi:hypothetical protein